MVSSYSESDLEYYTARYDTSDSQRPATATTTSSTVVSQGSGDCSIFGSPMNNKDEFAPEDTGAGGTLRPVTSKHEVVSGVRWNRVHPALNFLQNAAYEAQQSHCDRRLVRSLYINALGYLLDAAPKDLTSEESARIRRNLPDKVKFTLPTAEMAPHAAGFPNQQSSARYQHGRSYLHRLLSSGIIWLFIILQFLMPYIKLLLRKLYQFERSHHITERTIAATANAADSLTKGGFTLGSCTLSLREGQLGTTVSNLAAWWIESVAGGIYEGVGEGMMIMGLIRPNSELERVSMQFSRGDY
ncbi:uncharacterized protein ATNIH1004_000418 [Aspergillus tanneri]|nr:uncharacterized protein ATNIH1004_000418 [Aspergillus tanneri]KAA8651528.1 hypothetical protein ATNIH1004_000418 [Aspergillus tanneri]